MLINPISLNRNHLDLQYLNSDLRTIQLDSKISLLQLSNDVEYVPSLKLKRKQLTLYKIIQFYIQPKIFMTIEFRSSYEKSRREKIVKIKKYKKYVDFNFNI